MIRVMVVSLSLLLFFGCGKESADVIQMRSGEVLTIYFPDANRIVIDLEHVNQGIGLMGELGDFPSIERVSFLETANGVDQIAYSDKDGDGIPELKFVTKELNGEQVNEVYEIDSRYKLLRKEREKSSN